MELITKKDLQHKLHIQHLNTKQDAVNIVTAYFFEIEEFNELLRQKCTIHPHKDDKFPWTTAGFQQFKYDSSKKFVDVEELKRRLSTIKQRKPRN